MSADIQKGDKVYIKREEEPQRWGYVVGGNFTPGVASVSVREEGESAYNGSTFWWEPNELSVAPIERWWMEGC